MDTPAALLARLAAIDDPQGRVALCDRALRLIDRAREPLLWATVQSERGNALADARGGDRGETIERALAAYSAALEVFTRDEQPAAWAQLRSAMATLHRDQPAGDRAENLELAITAHEEVLAVRDRHADPAGWARTCYNLGLAYGQRRRGAAGENLERARQLFRDALTVRTRQAAPGLWARTQFNLANVYRLRPTGDRPANLRRAVALYREVLAVYERDTHPAEWGMVHHNLGATYHDLGRDADARAHERAIEHFRQALTVRTPAADLRGWATSTTGLANALRDRQAGAASGDPEEVLGLYEQVVAACAPAGLTREWISAHHNLGIAYRQRVGGEPAENGERALEHLRLAIDACAESADASERAHLLHDLGLALLGRVRGDRGENIELAIAAFEEALRATTRDGSPASWVRTQLAIAAAYRDRRRGDRARNLELAIATYRRALGPASRRLSPHDWAMAQNNLGTAFGERLFGERAENLDLAIAAYRQAFRVFTRAAFPARWAMTMNNLGIALHESRGGDQPSDIERAIEAYQAAHTVYTRDRFPLDWAMAWNNLGAAYRDRERGDRGGNLARAGAAFRRALLVRTRDAWPAAHRQTQRNLGDLHFAEGRWEKALAAYGAAIDVSASLYRAAGAPQARLAELRDAQELPARACYCLARLGRLDEAAAVLERGLALGAAEALARRQYASERASPRERPAIDALGARIASLEAEAMAGEGSGARGFAAISAALREARVDFEAHASRNAPVGARPTSAGHAARGADIAGSGGTIAYLLATPRGGLALIVPPDDGPASPAPIRAVWLDAFTADALDRLIVGGPGEPGYLDAVASGTGEPLDRQLGRIAAALADEVIGPLARQLPPRGRGPLTLVPVGLLQLVPLAALLGDIQPCATAPSAGIARMARLARRDRPAAPDNFLAIGNPLPDPRPLPFAESEVDHCAALFAAGRARILGREAATRAAVFAALPRATILHLACHGRFDAVAPLDSNLALARGDSLTLRDVLGGERAFAGLRLVVLSSCQSGLTDYRTAPTEALGFPTAFLQAGVRGVISALWPVDDVAASLLLGRFYAELLTGRHSPAEALQGAQRWLRETCADELGLAELWAARAHSGDAGGAAAAFRAARYYRANPSCRPFGAPRHWAAFAFYGAG